MKISSPILTQALLLIGALSHALVAAKEFRNDVHILMYETDGTMEGQPNTPLHFTKERSRLANLRTTVYGNSLDYRGFGDKYQTLRPILEVVNDETIVILADARDVALNIPQDEDLAVAAVDRFVENFKRMKKESQNAVILSAEAQCCVAAMSHAHPGEYFDHVTGERSKRACSSGVGDCSWSENENIHSWVDFMHQRAFDATGLEARGDVYLNAGLMAGYPKDLIKLLNIMDIEPYEDDQAVLTGLMYRYPEMIILDYGQEMFGNNQWTRGAADGCVFEGRGSQSPLTHLETQTQPLLIHTPGKFYACLDLIIEALGGESQRRYHPTTRKLYNGRLSLAAQLGFGGAGAVASVPGESVEKEEKSEEVEPDPVNYGYGVTNYGNANYGASSYGVTNYGQYGRVRRRRISSEREE